MLSLSSNRSVEEGFHTAGGSKEQSREMIQEREKEEGIDRVLNRGCNRNAVEPSGLKYAFAAAGCHLRMAARDAPLIMPASPLDTF